MYRDNIIVGETCLNKRCYVIDKNKEFRDTVNKYLGKFVKIEYDIDVKGCMFLYMDNIIHNIIPLRE